MGPNEAVVIRGQREGPLYVHGHASVTITFDRYGHLMPGSEEEAASLLDAYLTRTSDAIDAAHLASQSRPALDSGTQGVSRELHVAQPQLLPQVRGFAVLVLSDLPENAPCVVGGPVHRVEPPDLRTTRFRPLADAR